MPAEMPLVKLVPANRPALENIKASRRKTALATQDIKLKASAIAADVKLVA